MNLSEYGFSMKVDAKGFCLGNGYWDGEFGSAYVELTRIDGCWLVEVEDGLNHKERHIMKSDSELRNYLCEFFPL